ncbi:MAG: O-antigen ligase family protein [Myxococcota bacterium]|nr:O-antigen ligase family protein [Myxococcota bacterium]
MDETPHNRAVSSSLELRARACVEAGILGYLVQLPFASQLPPVFQTVALAAILVGLLLVGWADFVRSQPSLRFELLGPTLVFFASFGISIFTSDHRGLSAGRAYFLPIALLFFLALQVAVVSRASLLRLSFVLLAVIGSLGINGIYQAYSGAAPISGQSLYGERIRGGLPHPNDLAMIPILLPLAALAVTEASRRWLSAGGGLAIALGVATVGLSRSRNALLGLAVVVAVSLFASRSRRAWLALTALAVLAGGLVAVVDPQSAVYRLLDPALVRGDGRIGLWLSALEIFREAPLLGSGPFLFDRLYPSFVERVELPGGYHAERGYIPWVHSLYLEALAERGLLGLGSFLVLVALALRRVGSAWRDALTAASRNLAAALAASWAAFLVMGAVDLSFLKDWVWIVFALLVSLSARLRLLSAAPPTPGQ